MSHVAARIDGMAVAIGTSRSLDVDNVTAVRAEMRELADAVAGLSEGVQANTNPLRQV